MAGTLAKQELTDKRADNENLRTHVMAIVR